LNSLLHGTAEGETAFDLFGDSLGNQCSVGVRVLHFGHVHGNRAAFDDFLELQPQLFNGFAAFTNHDPRLRRVNRDGNVCSSAVNLDAGNARVTDFFHDEGANGFVLTDEFRIVLGTRIPTHRSGFVDAEAKTQGIDFISHYCIPSLPSSFALVERQFDVTGAL
jgi:hypothetical protein